MKPTKNNPQIGTDWTETKNHLPEERRLVVARIDQFYKGNEIELRRKGENWFFPDWTQKYYQEPTHWKYKQN